MILNKKFNKKDITAILGPCYHILHAELPRAGLSLI